MINETHTSDSSDLVYASLVTLRTGSGEDEQVISGYVSGKSIYISKLDKFNTSFVPEGTLLILHNYDEPGKIGGVGSILGKHGINIKFMSVAALDSDRGQEDKNSGIETEGNEALMILGIEGTVDREVESELRREQGILDVSIVRL